ncbi:disks large 1 tumor suppressor protein isoform X11 [Apis mellifera carnica]|nr:disks large 1 tumor suppressor protein isoform X11 [Apis mellifera carnica]
MTSYALPSVEKGPRERLRNVVSRILNFVAGCELYPRDIQEFYELTLLDESKSVQQKTAETIRIADKWEASDGPITPTFAQNDGGPDFPVNQTLSNIYGRKSASPEAPDHVDETQKTRYAGGGVEEQLPPPPSPPQLKEASQLDGVPRPNSVDRILHPDGSQHILTSHDTLNKTKFRETDEVVIHIVFNYCK